MAQVTDPVCGMMVDSEDAEAESTYQGTTYYFCSDDCKETFDENPSKFVKAGRMSESQPAGGRGGNPGTSRSGQGSSESDRWGQGGMPGGGRTDQGESRSGTETSKSGKGQNPGRSKKSSE